MRKYMRKGFAYVILTAMVFGMLPVSQREGIGLTDNTMRVCANIKNEIKSYNDLVEATATGGTYVLTNSVAVTNPIVIPRGVELTIVKYMLDLHGFTYGCENKNPGVEFWVGI